MKLNWYETVRKYEEQHLAQLGKESKKKHKGLIKRIIEFQNKPFKTADEMDTQFIASFTQWLLLSKGQTTVASYLRCLIQMTRWMHRNQLIENLPAFPRHARWAASGKPKGRAISEDEFERLLEAIRWLVLPCEVEKWELFLRGLWWGGLRMSEAFLLNWKRGSAIEARISEQDGDTLKFRGHAQKNGKNQTIPMAPEFADLIRDMAPNGNYHKLVLRPSMDVGLKWIETRINLAGRRAGIKVADNKWATAHDLRRSFGTRWAKKLMPADLQAMMRHANISTTMTYYVDIEAGNLSKRLRGLI